MGTNFYAKIIPTKERKEKLKQLIDTDNFEEIRAVVNEMYDSFHTYNDNAEPHGEIHLGKRSGGWKFLWNPNVYVIRHGHREDYNDAEGHSCSRWIEDPDTAYYVYPLTKKGIKAFIDREDVVVFDEYGEIQDKEEFWKMALEWTTWKDHKTGKTVEAWDGGSYEREHPNESKWVNDTELTRLLEREGYKFTSYTKSDFYSDGLRFSTSTDFS